MKAEEKKKSNKGFIRSSKFTYATYVALMVFRENIKKMTNLIELHLIFLKGIDSGDVKHTFSEEDITRVKSLVLMDVLSKIMIMIESLISLLDCFSQNPYKEIPQKMVRYKMKRINDFVDRFLKGKISEQASWRMFEFPAMKFLKINCGLTTNETEFIHELLSDSRRSLKRTVKEVIDFYSANRVLFWKSKHGLLFMAGLKFRKEKEGTPDSVFLAFDRLADKPPATLDGREIWPEGLEWFNTYSILPYSENTFNGYINILKKINSLSDHVIYNHLLWAFNCGEDYLPATILPDGDVAIELYLPKELSTDEDKIFRKIVKKVEKNVIFPKRLQLQFGFDFSDEKMRKTLMCFQEHQSATFWKPFHREIKESSAQG